MALLLGLACSDATAPEPTVLTAARLTVEQAAWVSQSIRDYDFDYQRICECLSTFTFRILVRDGVVTSAFATSGQDIAMSNPPTIDSVFAQARRDLDGGQYQLRATFHPALHFPLVISGDAPQVVDDEYTVRISNFVLK